MSTQNNNIQKTKTEYLSNKGKRLENVTKHLNIVKKRPDKATHNRILQTEDLIKYKL